MIVSAISLDTEKIKALHLKISHNFWSDELLNENARKHLQSTMKNLVFLEYLFWAFALMVVLLVLLVPYEHPKSIFNENWPVHIKVLYKIAYTGFVGCGYYLGNTHQTFYSYAVLRNYYHMKILIYYLREEMGKYKKVAFKRKLFSAQYQRDAKNVFLKSIFQHQALKALVCMVCYTKKYTELVLF